MRIIGGKFRGRKLEYITDEETRPTTDRIRESIFNVLGSKIRGAIVLDLFSGSGAFAAESISRGAKHVTANDIRPDAIETIKINCPTAEIHQLDFRVLLAQLKQKFDIIFVDPPYNSDFAKEAIELIKLRGLLAPNGIIVAHNDTSTPQIHQSSKVKVYGRTRIEFI